MSIKEDDEMATRRKALTDLVKGAGYIALGGLTWGGYVKEAKATEFALRPPGALPEKDFVKACIKCGLCVEHCPYDTLLLSEHGDKKVIGTPYFDARTIPCYMCVDIPCVPVCPTGALDVTTLTTKDEETQEDKLDINKAKMGVAVVDPDNCVAFWGIQCDACYRACPLMDEAISLVYEKNERTGKHAFLKPEVHREVCTGCGLCEHACITEEPSIIVLPHEIVTGKVGDHYIKGWDKNDEARLKNEEELEKKGDEMKSTLDYLNSTDDLFDEE